MINELIWLLFAVLNFILVLAAYRIFGKTGLFVWVGVATVIANIQVVKTVELFGMVATLGNILYGTAFLATDILNEKYGKGEARKAVWLGFFVLLSMTLIMQVALVFKPHEIDFAQGSLETIFGLQLRIAAGSLTAYIISQYLDVWLYGKLKQKFNKNSQLWIRNNGSTMLSQLIDTLIFTSIAFIGVFPFGEWLMIAFSTYIIKWIVAVLDTPFMYIAKRFHNGGETAVQPES
ncbi:queuosine precursor transporter [Bacillus marinisedimentorum]|uniref:queuosine precursor transporter n=1 Tax=Bacillus marinisedimentorum TaxID=1821260 RepID=UPI0007DEF0AF|nr:queuosine precursor transporter [Bacillus marinisedimentorum]